MFLKKKGYVDVAFYTKRDLEKYNEFLISENRKVVKSLRYKNSKEIDLAVLRSVLEEAYQKTNKGFFGK